LRNTKNISTNYNLINVILFFSTLIFFNSCGGDKNTQTIPKNIVSQQQFTNIITDFLISESASNLNLKTIAINKFDSAYAFNPLKENNVTKPQYDSALNFYSMHPALYKQVYEDAIEQLHTKQTKRRTFDVADSLNKLKKDSILTKNAK